MTPELCFAHPRKKRGRRECRVPGRTHSPMYKCKKYMGVVTTGEAKHRHSLRNGVNGLSRAHPGETGPCCLRRRAIPRVSGPKGRHRDHRTTWHLPLGRRACTPWPSARAVARLATPRTSIASRPTIVTTRSPLLPRRDAQNMHMILRKTEVIYFPPEDWTSAIFFGLTKMICPSSGKPFVAV
jgi:hypothetical protein